MQSQKAQENTAAFTVKQGLLKQDNLCEATLLQNDNPAEVKYSPPGKRHSTLIVAAKCSPKSFQKILYLQHNLWDISALIKESLEKCSDIPWFMGWGCSSLSMLAPAPDHSELLCLPPLPCPRLLWCPCTAESCPSTVMAKSDTFLCWFSTLERDISVKSEGQIPRTWQRTAGQREEIISELFMYYYYFF